MFIVFAKGEIIMNNIYKVIWSKARNCYVVASEIAKSHTKSASGQSVRRSALASLLALSLLCGGWGVASASLEVLDQSGTAGTVTIYTKDEVDNALTAKGTAADVASNKEAITNLKNAVGDAGSGLTKEVADQKAAIAANTASITTNKDNITQLDTKKLDKDLANSTFATKDALNGLAATVNNKVDESVVETALDGKADKADTLAGYGITDAYTKGDVDNKLNEKADAAKLADYAKSADVYTKTDADGKFATSAALDTAKTDLEGKITTAKNELDGKIAANTTKINANETAINQLNTKAATTETTLTDLSGRMAAAESDIGTLKADVSTAKSDIGTLKADMTTAKSDIGTLKADVSTAKSDINSLKMKDTELTGKIEAEIANRITSDTALDHKIDTEIQDRKDAIKATNDRTGGIARNLEGTQTTIEGIVKVDNQGNVKDVKGLSAETITTTGDAAIGGTLGVTGATTLNGALTANGEATFKDKVSVEKDLTVNGKLNVGEIYLKNDKLESTGKKHDSATSITADGISNLAKVTEHGNTTESQFTHNKKGTINYAKDGNTTDWKESTSKVTADGVSNKMTDSDKNTHTYSQTATESKEQLVNGDKSNFEKKTAEGNTISIKDKDAAGNLKSLTNKQTVDGEKTSVTNNESSSTINQGADQIRHNVTSAGKESSIEVKADGITNTSKDGTITNDAKDIVNNATGNMTNTVGGDLTTTVGGNELHEVTGKQTNKIDGDQVNTIGGNQTTNVTGDISNTAKNITNAATDTLTDKVGENTRVINSRSITDTVGRANRMIEDGKITDNAGDFTVTTDKENGTTFTNAGSTAASSFTTVDGTNTGSAPEWTNIKGNEISTGKVEANYVKMDYADVMNDLGVKGTTTTKTLKVTENATVGGTLDVTQKATFHDDVDIKKNLSVDGNATITGDVTAHSYKVGRNTYIDENGINANNQKITNVADGSISEGSKDAVNGGQLYGVKRDLEHQVDKVGANAAAMANLRPMEFDPSSKWNIAAAIGNYGSETAAAIGAFYRPNDNVMVNLSTAFGTGENMVGGGVSVRLGKGGNKLSREETNALKAQVADLTARMDALLSVLNPNMSKDFPDVPENHWAYEAVSRLAGNDIVQGYPDGEFHGERTMTRYEMAEIIYNALSRGAEAERKLVEEFKPELQAMAASEKSTAEKAEG